MKIKISGALLVMDGYGYITQELSLALAEYGHEIWLEPFKGWYSDDQQKPGLHKLKNKLKGVDFELIIYYPGVISSNHNSGILTMYEADKLPTQWTKLLSGYGNVFGPSNFVVDVFKDSGVTSNIKLLPLGIDKKIHTYRERKKDGVFRFLSLGKMEPRKNTETLIEAFRNSFGNNKDVELIVKTREGFASPKVKGSRLNNVKILEKTVTEDIMLSIYYNSHCFVYPSRGEGFSFPPRNALATGMPTIVTGWSALNEINGAFKIPVKSFSPMHPCGFSYGEEKNLLMADIDVNTLSHMMLKVYDNFEEAKEVMLSRYREIDWSESAFLITEIIKSLV